MCYNCSIPRKDADRYNKIAELIVERHLSDEEIAQEMECTVEDVLKDLEFLKGMNPLGYETLMKVRAGEM